jgi:DNA repair protein RadC
MGAGRVVTGPRRRLAIAWQWLDASFPLVCVESASVADTGAQYRTIRELADDERPRERLLKHGPQVLSDAELIAIILQSGMRGENVVDMARGLVETAGGLAGLVRSDTQALQRTKGLGPAKAAQLAAAIELGRRAHQTEPDSRPLLTTPEAVFSFMGGRMMGKSKEELYVLSLDTKGRLLGSPHPIGGGVNSISIRPAEVFQEPVVLHAASVILVHNHPSGDPSPSPQDVTVTADLVKAGALLEVAVLDHVIVGQGRFVSLKRDGRMR